MLGGFGRCENAVARGAGRSAKATFVDAAREVEIFSVIIAALCVPARPAVPVPRRRNDFVSGFESVRCIENAAMSVELFSEGCTPARRESRAVLSKHEPEPGSFTGRGVTRNMSELRLMWGVHSE